MKTFDKEQFRSFFLEASGEEWTQELPDTLEELLMTASDPDEFDRQLAPLLQAIQTLMEISGPLQVFNLDGLPEPASTDPLVVLGNLEVDLDSWLVDRHTYVLGNLHVKGNLFGDLHQILVVGGDLTCDGMQLCRTYLFANGHIHVKRKMLAMAYGIINVSGLVHTPVYIQDETFIVCDSHENALDAGHQPDKINAGDLYLDMAFDDPELIKGLRKLFGEEKVSVDENGYWQFDHFFD